MTMLRWLWLGIGLSLFGCGAKVLEFESNDGTAGTNGSGSGASSGGSGAGSGASAGGSGASWSQSEPSLCAGNLCSANETCCFLDGTCFDPSTEPEACPTPPGDATGPRCASNADCSLEEFCESDSAEQNCLGPGRCVSRSNCGTSGGMEWCGCDGITYPDKQTSCLHGVRIATRFACGEAHEEGGGGAPGGPPPPIVTGCGDSGDCSGGQTCCYIYGKCTDPTHPYMCTFPPAGTRASCENALDCYPFEYCKADTCGAPGGCVSPKGTCEGVVDPVCGCDGQTYESEGCASSAGVDIDHAGPCI